MKECQWLGGARWRLQIIYEATKIVRRARDEYICPALRRAIELSMVPAVFPSG